MIIISCAKINDYEIKNNDGLRSVYNKISYSEEIVESTQLSEYKIEFNDSTNFKTINEADVDRHGKIYMSDDDLSRIYIFNKEGKFESMFGRKGKGPGEIDYLFSFFVIEDTVFISQPSQRKLDKYSLSGQFYGANYYPDSKLLPKKIVKSNSFVINRYNGYEGEIYPEEFYFQKLNVFNYDLRYMNETNIAHKIKTYINQPDHPYNEDDEIFAFTAIDDIIYTAVNSDNQYLIEGYDPNGVKKTIIRKRYTKISIQEEQKDKIKNENLKYGIVNSAEFYKAIYDIQRDKFNRLWVKTKSNKTGSFYYDIFEEGILKKSYIPETDDVKLFLRGDKLITYNAQDSVIRIFDYIY